MLKNGIYFTLDGDESDLNFLFISSDLRSISAEYEQYTAEYNVAQQSLVEKITDVALTYMPLFNIFSSLISQLDLLSSFAYVSTTAVIPYTRPKFLDITKENCRSLDIRLKQRYQN